MKEKFSKMYVKCDWYAKKMSISSINFVKIIGLVESP